MMFLAHALVSIGGMAIFAHLAIHFDKWWIILFSFVVLGVRYTSRKDDDDTKSKDGESRIRPDLGSTPKTIE